MSIVSIMAAILEAELREHGVLKLTQLDCETIIHNMIERTAELAVEMKQYWLEPNPSDGT